MKAKTETSRLANHSLFHASNYFDLESIRLGTGGLAGFDAADGGLGLPEGTGGFAEGFVVGAGGLC